jgi:pheromone shutdown protein TraB
LVGISYMTALVEAWARKPKVKDFEALPEDILTVKGWWHNQVTRVLLVFILSGVGGALGNFIAYGILFGRLFGKG